MILAASRISKVLAHLTNPMTDAAHGSLVQRAPCLLVFRVNRFDLVSLQCIYFNYFSTVKHYVSSGKSFHRMTNSPVPSRARMVVASRPNVTKVDQHRKTGTRVSFQRMCASIETQNARSKARGNDQRTYDGPSAGMSWV